MISRRQKPSVFLVIDVSALYIWCRALDMAKNIAKLVLTQTLKKGSSIIQKESLTDSDIASLNRIKEQLARKKGIL